jgi:quercetin 2,3-dioxygenase
LSNGFFGLMFESFMANAPPADGPLKRRDLLLALPGATLGLTSFSACRAGGVDGRGKETLMAGAQTPSQEIQSGAASSSAATSSAASRIAPEPVLEVFPLGFQWPTFDPFLFCVHHQDAYPPGNEAMGPARSLAGRNLGQDFEGKDGFRMYHGETVPGFPRHPHRGFETITITRRGFIDHSDSLGATARYGEGDVQWMTAGRGIVHAEMFPLLETNSPNPTELFQIWINLPRSSKFVAPYFSMFWKGAIPERDDVDGAGRKTSVRVIAGVFKDRHAIQPPPNSFAAKTDAEVAIWSIEMAPGATLTLPPAVKEANRTLYFFRGRALRIGSKEVPSRVGARVRGDAALTLINGAEQGGVLLLQGRPIGEPVVQRGPFVMNEPHEIEQAFSDYQRTLFGGWPWPNADPVHARREGRFAIHADGRKERAG